MCFKFSWFCIEVRVQYRKWAKYLYSFTHLKPNNHLKSTIFSVHKEISDTQGFLPSLHHSLSLYWSKVWKEAENLVFCAINENFSSTISELSKHRDTSKYVHLWLLFSSWAQAFSGLWNPRVLFTCYHHLSENILSWPEAEKKKVTPADRYYSAKKLILTIEIII